MTSLLCRLYQQVWLLCCVVSISKCDFCCVVFIINCDFYTVSTPSASVSSLPFRLRQLAWLLCCAVFVSKCDLYAISSASANVTSMLCRVRQQVCLLCCAVFVSKPLRQMCEDAVKSTRLFNIPEQEKQNQKRKMWDFEKKCWHFGVS